MTFDWLTFFRDHGIHYVEQGPNVARDNVNIKCPFCGPNDPSEHMGVAVDTGLWGCWRDSAHRGRNPKRLIKALLGCSEAEAIQIAGQKTAPAESDLARVVRQLGGETKHRPFILDLPQEAINFAEEKYSSNRFLKYLANRGFEDHVDKLTRFYDLHYAINGKWEDRIILPIYNDNRLVNYTGRSIHKDAVPRYMTVSNKDAPTPLKEMVWHPPGIESGGDVLFVTEGPFDALKLDFFASGLSCRATCLFGVSYTDNQVLDLIQVSKPFDKVVILFDTGFDAKAYRLSEQLVSVNSKVMRMPNWQGVSDPGDLSPKLAQKVARMALAL